MAGKWMTAASKFGGYKGHRRGDLDRTSVQACRSVLSRLAQRANDAGVVTIYVADLEQHTGLSYRAVRYALAQLRRDGWIWHAVRGQGSRSGEYRGTPTPSVYVIRPLPQYSPDGATAPARELLAPAWSRYALSGAYLGREQHQRTAIRQALEAAWNPEIMPVDNHDLQARKARPTGNGLPALHKRDQLKSKYQRSRLTLVPDLPADLVAELTSIRPGTELPPLTPFLWLTDKDRLTAVGT